MEIPSWAFFSFWSLTGVVSLFLGIEALDKTDLPNLISPAIMSLFKHSLALSVYHSSTYALIFRPKLNTPVKKYYSWMLFAVFPIAFSRIAGDSFSWHFPIYSLIDLFVLSRNFLPEMKIFFFEDYFCKLSVAIALLPLLRSFSPDESSQRYFTIYISNFMIIFQFPFAAVPEEQVGLFVHFAAVSSLILVGGKTNSYYPNLVLCFAFFTSVAQAAISGDERLQKWPAAARGQIPILLKLKRMMKKNGKAIEFGIRIGGTILFQNFFRLTSFDHVVAFLYFALAWLANLALLLSNHDLGIFNFLLGNVILGCTVNQFGLQGTTWIAYGASVILYGLRMKLKALSLVKRKEYQASVVRRD